MGNFTHTAFLSPLYCTPNNVQKSSQYFIERLRLRIKYHLLFSLKDCISLTANLKRPPVSKIHNKAIQQNM